jgi:hypothetical protein
VAEHTGPHRPFAFPTIHVIAAAMPARAASFARLERHDFERKSAVKTKSSTTSLRSALLAVLVLVLGSAWLPGSRASAQLGLPLGSLVVTVTEPVDRSTVSGTTTVRAQVSIVGALTVSSVQFKLDGNSIGAADTSAPYSIAWDTRTASNGLHNLTAWARDGLGVQWESQAIQITIANDLTPPAVTINQAAGQSDPTSVSPIAFTAAFSEAVSGFTAADVAISGTAGGTKTVTITGGPSVYTVSVSGMTSDGTVGATIAAGRATDGAGNANTASTSSDNSVTFTAPDTTAPTVTINQAAGQSDPTSASPIAFTAVFSEAVSGFTAADVTISGTANGTKTVTVTGGPSVYTVSVSGMTSDGTIDATIAAGGATDGAGNGNTASTSSDNSVTFTAPDTTGPTVTINQAAGQSDPTSASPIAFTAVFSEAVSGFTAADVTISGTAAGTKTVTVSGGPSTYTVAVSGMTSDGTVSATVAAGGATDGAGNANTASTSSDNSVTFAAPDTTAPTVTINQAAGQSDPTSASPIAFTAVFSEAVSGFTAADVTIGGTAGGTKTVTVTGGPSTYNVAVSGMSEGTVTATIAAGGATDAAGNANTASTSSDNSVTFGATDTTAPTVSINQAAGQADPASASPINFTAVFSEAVSDFAAADVTISGTAGGTKTVAVTGGPSTYNVAVSGATNGTVIATIAAGVAHDASGNANTAATSTDNSVTIATTVAGTWTRIENTDRSIAFSAGTSTVSGPLTWGHGSRSRDWSGGTASANRSVNARATLTFNGTSATWIGFRAPWAGQTKVYVDGTFAADVDLYASAEEVQASVYTVSGLAPGTHTLTVEVTGGRNLLATDNAVVVDAFEVGPAMPVPVTGTRFEESSLAASFTGTWTAASERGWSGGAALQASAGAEATFTFTGTAVRWMGLRGPQAGVAQVFLDGAFHRTINLSSPNEFQAIVFAATHLAPGRHTLRVVPMTAAPVVVDAFDVQSRFEDTDLGIVYTGSWLRESTDRTWSGTTANSGTGTASLTSGGQAEFTFRGTSITWIGFRGPQVGAARVFLDGTLVAEVDTNAPAEEAAVPVFTATGLSDATHTLRIEAVGATIVLDAFDVTLSTAAPVVSRFQETDASITYTAGWTLGSQFNMSSGERVTVSDVTDAAATFTFTGTGVRWIGYLGSNVGIARVLIDGVLVATVDSYAGLQEHFQGVSFSAAGLTDGPHTLTIQVTGTRNPSSSNPRIVIDAFEVLR